MRAAVFLDRDGTIIRERHYLAEPSGVELIPGAASAIQSLAEAGFALVIITNQSGIARGLVSPAQYEAVHDRLTTLLAEHGVHLDGAYHCPHHPDWTGPCSCRKPELGLYQTAASELELDLSRSHFVGDKVSDVRPADALGGTGYLVRTGHGTQEVAAAPEHVPVFDDLAAVARAILRRRPVCR